jgi:hypothetical protein
MTFTKPEAYFWEVESIDSNHIGHSQPYRMPSYSFVLGTSQIEHYMQNSKGREGLGPTLCISASGGGSGVKPLTTTMQCMTGSKTIGFFLK